MERAVDAILVVSFGGPERPEDVIPFLENVLRGKNVPRARLLEVAEHYYHFGGISPINAQNRLLIAALRQELSDHGIPLPIYWGNRNWHPLLTDTVRQMTCDGIRRALVFVTSAFSSYSGCRQYQEDLDRARSSCGDQAPGLEKLRGFYNHPGFILAVADRIREAWPSTHGPLPLVAFTAHSIPQAMASRCDYVQQLQEACRLVAKEVEAAEWTLAYQSRSGPPTQPWLEPDIADCLLQRQALRSLSDVVLVPIGFVSDHMEVLYDLDFEIGELARRSGFRVIRVPTVGTHPLFVRMIRELIEERIAGGTRRSLGTMEPRPDVCPTSCCLIGN